MKILNKRIPNDKFPPVILHFCYVMIALTFSYLYYHKYVQGADFFLSNSPGGIWAVANFESTKPIQFRILIPLIFKGLSYVVHIPDKPLYFLMLVAQAYLILLSFYFLLNRHFVSKVWNGRLALVIIYPMIWNLIIMNGMFFYMDFGLLLSMIIGYYLIVSRRYNWLLLVLFIGLLNHSGVLYLIVSFVFFNCNRLLKLETMLYTIAMTVIYIGTIVMINYMLPDSMEGTSLVYNLPRNLWLLIDHPKHLLIRDFLFNFGGMHFFVLVFLLSGKWKLFKGPYLYVHFMIVIFFITLMLTFSVEEMRNYSAIIPNIIILSLLFLSTFENSFLKPCDNIQTKNKKIAN